MDHHPPESVGFRRIPPDLAPKYTRNGDRIFLKELGERPSRRGFTPCSEVRHPASSVLSRESYSQSVPEASSVSGDQRD